MCFQHAGSIPVTLDEISAIDDISFKHSDQSQSISEHYHQADLSMLALTAVTARVLVVVGTWFLYVLK